MQIYVNSNLQLLEVCRNQSFAVPITSPKNSLLFPAGFFGSVKDRWNDIWMDQRLGRKHKEYLEARDSGMTMCFQGIVLWCL